ncbi:alpha/beta family hydrolase [Polynucleobacter sp. JS-JIR-II-c23]|uniref:alpha/beta family hydrolase n=1 Tax=Polynucleobacter sp. JS-JIR-II-c23 TaxID=1758393 RepID=UPI002B23E518|nr:alpha/beta family hydrolase [Polynucleobacter sp. JS-JIR-II-c23]MEA9603821.1 alpha/beta family hydrolase [Polynucleobacter sp. JS-JIR-II-c23]
MEQQFTQINGNEIAYIGDLSSINIIFIIGRSNSNKYSAPLDSLLNKLCYKNYLVIWPNWPKHEKDFEFNDHLQLCKGLLIFLGHHRSITILSHSVGGRIAANLAHHIHIKRIICFGYPFKHPEEPEDIKRTAVLEGIQTPVLIIQGRFDEYGGADVQEKYHLSTSVEMVNVDSNHDYEHLSHSDWDLVINNVGQFIEVKN